MNYYIMHKQNNNSRNQYINQAFEDVICSNSWNVVCINYNLDNGQYEA